MKKMIRIITLIAILFAINSFSQTQKFEWAGSFGSTAGDHAVSICTDQQGNVFSTGSFSGTVDFDPGVGVYNVTAVGTSDCIVIKLNSKGNFIWAINFGSGPNAPVGGHSIITIKQEIYMLVVILMVLLTSLREYLPILYRHRPVKQIFARSSLLQVP